MLWSRQKAEKKFLELMKQKAEHETAAAATITYADKQQHKELQKAAGSDFFNYATPFIGLSTPVSAQYRPFSSSFHDVIFCA